MSNQPNPAADSAVTRPTVSKALGFPVERVETSQEPTGWLVQSSEVSQIGKKEKVSRETF